MMHHPFQINSGNTVGVSTSSLAHGISPLNTSPLGQAQISTVVNVSTGNLYVADFHTPIASRGFHLNVGMGYNSVTGWRVLSQAKESGIEDISKRRLG